MAEMYTDARICFINVTSIDDLKDPEYQEEMRIATEEHIK